MISFLERLRSSRYVMKLDIVHYFPSVSWDILLRILAAKIMDERLLRLLSRVLASGEQIYQSEAARAYLGCLPPPRHGLPIGNFTSQWFGNFYLDELDHFIKRELKVKEYQRYMDDMTLFGDTAQQLAGWRKAISQWFTQERGLNLHLERAQVRRCGARHDYLGYRISLAGITPGKRLRRRARERLTNIAFGDPQRVARSLASYRGAMLFPR